VQIVDAAPHYGLLSVQGSKALEVVSALNLFPEIPTQQLGSIKISDATLGEIYIANNPRLDGTQGRAGSPLPAVGAHGVTRPTNFGFDLFIPNNSLGAVADKLIFAAKQIGGRAIGWTAFETARIENGIPRFGADMDETNIPLECNIESRAIVYNKGCYIGQEVINRIHSVGHVTRELRGLRLADDLKTLPQKHDKLFHAGKEVGYMTSAVKSPSLKALVALGYVRREANQIGNELTLRTAAGESSVKIVDLPFVK
ncbi:MAG TPA: glycine cleavage T C-terminal barrel domain-containing protein, partial [Verrucomicrobiae bacterium]|nr:glycine cleavage T C-terminal barrel domain-containing protein [Verrucomicrobiae bacterium]